MDVEGSGRGLCFLGVVVGGEPWGFVFQGSLRGISGHGGYGDLRLMVFCLKVVVHVLSEVAWGEVFMTCQG